MSYNDAVSITASAGGASTYIPTPSTTTGGGFPTGSGGGSGSMEDGGSGGNGDPVENGESGSGNDFGIPEDFQGESSWSAGIGLSASSGGTLFLSSTPSIGSDSAISQAIIANVTYDVGGKVTMESDWSSGSYSGNLVFPNHPNPGAGNPLAGCDIGASLSDASAGYGLSTGGSDMPTEPVGPIVGNGHASSSGGQSGGNVGGKINGGWNLNGVIKGGQWESLTGGAMAALNGDTGGIGKSEHLFIYAPAPVVMSSTSGTTTTKVFLISGWDYDGTSVELADAMGNEVLSASNGEIQSDSSGSTADIKGDPKLVGFKFLVLQASINNVSNTSSSLGIGSNVAESKLAYNSFDQGNGIGDYRSAVAGIAPASADLSSDIHAAGKSFLVLTSTSKIVWDSVQDWGNGPSTIHMDDENKVNTELTSEYTANGHLNAELLADDTISWTGSAGEQAIFKVKYKQEWKRTDSVDSPNDVGDILYIQTRNADYDAKLVQSNVLNPVTGVLSTTYTRSGDPHVRARSSMLGVQELPTLEESKLEAIITGISPPELEQWDGTGGPIIKQEPSNSYVMAFVGWFGGTAGDSGDRAINFTAGVADAMTMNVSYLTRNAIGADYIDYDGDYNGGQITGTAVGIVAGGPALIKGAVAGAKAVGTGVGNLTKCGTALGKIIGRECFVAGTLVTLSELPRELENESTLWSNDEWDFEAAENQNDLSLSLAGSRRSATLSPVRTLVPIEQVPLGARVSTKNPEPWEYDFSLPDPVREKWVKITILYEGDDGRVNDIELIRPKAWIESNEIVTDTWIPINIPELSIVGRALVASIEACPAMAEGSGSVVTGRFITREVNTIARAEIVGVDGTIEIIEGTPTHPFWSVDRNGWVPFCELIAGEHLQAAEGVATVLAIAVLQSAQPVYNVEVHGEHVYEVGGIGMLVHNACSSTSGNNVAAVLGKRMHANYMQGMANGLTTFKEFVLPSGKRIDFLDVAKGIVYELKPNNARQIARGGRQIAGYIAELKNMPQFAGINWTSVLHVY
ncbi:MAG: hypothetical protein WCK15_22830 [Pirellula sp.]